MKKIEFSKQNILPADLSAVSKIIKGGWLTHGKYTELFEKELGKYTGTKYAVTVSSCTAGLHLSCLALGFKKGDEVIVPSVTHTATAHAVEYTGAKAIFADVDALTGNIDLQDLKKKISKKTKGLIIVHMAGITCEISEIKRLCKNKKIKLIEDCAHGLGTKYKKKHVGNFGETGCFSFYPTKQITTGEGGAVVTNNKKIYLKIKKLKAFGIDKDLKDRKKAGVYDVQDLGFNYRMTDFQAALGYFQLKRYKQNLIKRKKIAKKYIELLSNEKNIKFPAYSSNNSYFIFQVLCKNRDKIVSGLKSNKIFTSIHYATPLTSMSYYQKKYKINSKRYKNSNNYSKNNISLPNYPKLSILEVEFICSKLKELSNK